MKLFTIYTKYIYIYISMRESREIFIPFDIYFPSIRITFTGMNLFCSFGVSWYAECGLGPPELPSNRNICINITTFVFFSFFLFLFLFIFVCLVNESMTQKLKRDRVHEHEPGYIHTHTNTQYKWHYNMFIEWNALLQMHIAAIFIPWAMGWYKRRTT